MTSAKSAGMTYRLSFSKHPYFGFALLGCFACSSPHDRDAEPKGPVAHDASEAWPDQPSNVPVLAAEDVVNACAIAGACSPEVMDLDVATRAQLVDLCVSDVVFSAERAIPLTGFRQANERPEFWVRCVLDNANQCGLVAQCRTDRASWLQCEEDGCTSSIEQTVSCAGNVATLTTKEGTATRDCTRAFAVCDPSSATGCSDRQFSRCPEDYSRVDRCDGNIRLGCDGKDQVSYRDCTRLGGMCGVAADGSEDCRYPGADPGCPKTAECSGTTLRACIQGRALSVETPLCQSSTR
jgi:hypothetical protein